MPDNEKNARTERKERREGATKLLRIVTYKNKSEISEKFFKKLLTNQKYLI